MYIYLKIINKETQTLCVYDIFSYRAEIIKISNRSHIEKNFNVETLKLTINEFDRKSLVHESGCEKK